MSEAEETSQLTPEHSGPKKAAMAMFGLLLLTYVLMVADRFLVSMLATDIRGALDLSIPNMFALTTMFTLGLGIGGLPAAALIARYSRKAVLITGLILLSSATLLFTKATGFASMFVFIVLQGVGMSFLATAMFSLSTSYFSANRVAALGLVNLCFGLGSLLGHRIIGEMRTAMGSWEAPMLIFGFAGIVMAIAIAIFVRPWFSEVKPAAKHLVDSGGADTLKNHNTILLSGHECLIRDGNLRIPGHLSFLHAWGSGVTSRGCGCGNDVVRRWRTDVLLRRQVGRQILVEIRHQHLFDRAWGSDLIPLYAGPEHI